MTSTTNTELLKVTLISSHIFHLVFHLSFLLGNLRAFRWWMPTHKSTQFATTLRNISSSPAVQTERCVWDYYYFITSIITKCSFFKSHNHLIYIQSVCIIIATEICSCILTFRFVLVYPLAGKRTLNSMVMMHRKKNDCNYWKSLWVQRNWHSIVEMSMSHYAVNVIRNSSQCTWVESLVLWDQLW